MAEVFFNGPAGRIEGLYTTSTDKRAPLALILHPHPSHGGNFNSKIVHRLYTSLAKSGYAVLRINFRGVGKSQGQFDNGIGELSDAATALDWLQLNNPESAENLVAGFSFGAWITMQLIMRRPEIKRFIAVAPPVNKYDFTFLSPCPCPGLIIQGDQDSIVPEEMVLELANKLTKQKNIRVEHQLIKGADHFFRDKLDELSSVVTGYLNAQAVNNSDNDEGEKISDNKIYL